MIKVEISIPKKIHIMGSVGSGKTTLARALSSEVNVPFYELDNVVWKRNINGDIRRSPEERDNYLRTIVESSEWIVEGVHYTWVSASIEKADLILFLDTDFKKRKFRITKRFVLQMLGIEKANYKPTFRMYVKMFKWNKDFEKESKPEILKMLNEYKNKVIVLKNKKDIDALFDLNAYQLSKKGEK